MNNPDALATDIDTNVNRIISELNSKELITKVYKDSLKTLLNNEKNNVMTALNLLSSIQDSLKLMETKETNEKLWIETIKVVKQNKNISEINAHIKLAGINAIINKIKTKYNLVWTLPSQQQLPLSLPTSPQQLPILPPLSQPLPPPLPPLPPSQLTDNIKRWKLMLDWVKKYIDDNKKKPSKVNENMKKPVNWIEHQQKNYQKRNRNMSNEIFRKLWEDFINDDKYKKYF
jgi:hypothetical protein